MKKLVYILFIATMFYFLIGKAIAQESIFQKDTSSFNIFPNPVLSGQVIKLDVEAGEHQLVSYYVYDFAGKLMLESTQHRVGLGFTHIELEMNIEQQGLFFVKVILEDEDNQSIQSLVNKLYVN